jgi:hypothetical protein
MREKALEETTLERQTKGISAPWTSGPMPAPREPRRQVEGGYGDALSRRKRRKKSYRGRRRARGGAGHGPGRSRGGLGMGLGRGSELVGWVLSGRSRLARSRAGPGREYEDGSGIADRSQRLYELAQVVEHAWRHSRWYRSRDKRRGTGSWIRSILTGILDSGGAAEIARGGSGLSRAFAGLVSMRQFWRSWR